MSSSLRTEIIAVGSELLGADRAETNSLHLARRLETIGGRVRRKWVVEDRVEDIAQALQSALDAHSDIVILSGGLGPTNDDLTRDGVSEALGLKLETDDALVEWLRDRFKAYGVRLTPNNLRQAQVPQGAKPLENRRGSAPGLFLRHRESLIFLLPGPPNELEPMVEKHVLPLIAQYKETRTRYSRILKVAAVSESKLDDRIEKIYQAFPQIEVTILASPIVIEIRLIWIGDDDRQEADRQLDELESRIAAALSESVYARQDLSLQEVVGQRLRERAETLATAESCTGGWIGKLLTDTAGSSDYYLGGVTAYSNAVKTTLLGVNETNLERCGAVSKPTAEQMASGIRAQLAADWGLAVTGVAGPGGGSPDKPVGLVFLGLAGADGVHSRRLQLPGDRKSVRLRTACLALDWLRRHLT